ncbi:hypothetical protein EKI60_06510 [Candidatus Saccharibacteria bacterium]|nr:MAG: hypothetical protein EKI60_06510 [Candidatus Saccharibacteria bacterium]
MGRPKGSKNKSQNFCSVVDCKEIHYGKGLCRYHWRKQPKQIERERKYAVHPETRERNYRRRMKIKYGLTPDQYDKIYESQQGRCKLCNKHQSELTIRLCIEHDHKTSKVRGLTCHECNIEIRLYELFKDNPEKVKKIEEYLNALPVSS